MSINLEEIGNKSLLRFSYKQASDQLHLSAALPRQGATATTTNSKHLLKINIWEMVTILRSLLLPRVLYSSKNKKLQMGW